MRARRRSSAAVPRRMPSSRGATLASSTLTAASSTRRVRSGAVIACATAMATPDSTSTSAPTAAPSPARSAWAQPGSRRRRLLLAAIVYLAASVVYAAFAGRERLGEHTPFNHYALMADAWLHGRQDLAHGPPAYAMNNDFAEFNGKTYISFPPFPAVLMLPLVKLAGTPENFRDGQFIIWLAGIAPAVLLLVLEKLRRTGRSYRTELENVALALLFAFGTVYFFTAVEGTVWFAAMVVGTACQALYVLFALDAERPVLAGAMLGCAFLSRPSMLLAAPLFALEAARVACREFPPSGSSLLARCRNAWRDLDLARLAKSYVAFAIPILVAFGFNSLLNHARYQNWSPFDPGHEYLTVGWRGRMIRWGLVSYHYLGKNLGVALTNLPWLPSKDAVALFGAPFKINEHGLALWFTTPIYFWILWPKRFDGQPERKWLYVVAAISAALPAAMDLLYQNTGWRQFGYRFSNDYAVLLFVLLAVGARPMRAFFATCAAWGLAWNVFGAATFDKSPFDRFYFRDGSQTVVYQPD
jgi:hypothetical protein